MSLYLATTSDILRLVTSTANALDVQVSWVDNATATPFAPNRTNTAIASATTTTVLPSPAASTQRCLKEFSANAKGGINTVTVEFFDGATAFRKYKVPLGQDETLEYEDLVGWMVRDANCALKTIGFGGGAPVLTSVGSGLTQTISGPLSADQVVVWQSATSGTKATTIPTATGSLRQITVVDGQGNAGTAGQNITVTPVGGSILGSPDTTTIIDDRGKIKFYDMAVNTWVAIA